MKKKMYLKFGMNDFGSIVFYNIFCLTFQPFSYITVFNKVGHNS